MLTRTAWHDCICCLRHKCVPKKQIISWPKCQDIFWHGISVCKRTLFHIRLRCGVVLCVVLWCDELWCVMRCGVVWYAVLCCVVLCCVLLCCYVVWCILCEEMWCGMVWCVRPETPQLGGCAPKPLPWFSWFKCCILRYSLLITSEYYGGQHETPKCSCLELQAVSQNKNLTKY